MPGIATLYATILPETSQIAEGMTRAFRQVDPAAAEAGRRWGREIQRGLGDAKVELKADTTKAKSEIEAAAKDQKATVELDADTAKAQAQIDLAARDRKATIEVDADTLGSSVQRTMSQVGPQMSGQLAQSLVGAGTQASSPVAGSLSSAMGPVGTALTAALVAGGITAAAGIAAALSGAIGLIPAGLGGGLGVIGTLITGLDGVKDAWDAAGKAAQSAGKDQEEKTKAVASAEKSLRNAVLDEATAQKDVANARRDARQQLEDLNVQLRGGVIDEKQAILDARAARRDLATGRFRDSIEYQQAQLRVEQADQRVLEAHERNVELQQKATRANAQGVEGSDQVVAANQRLAKAHDDVAAAQQNLASTQSKPSSNMEALAQAMAKLSPGAQAFVKTLQGLKPVWDALKFSVQDSLFAGLGPQIQRLATQYMPVLQSMMTSLAGTMNSAFRDLGTWLSKPETMASIQTIIANIASSFQIWSKSLEPFSQAFLTITKVGSGFLPQLAQAITDGATAFNKFIQEASRSGELKQWMQTGIQSLGELMKMLPVLGKMFLDLAPIGIPVLQSIGMTLRALEPVFRLFGAAVGGSQTFINQFWSAMGRLGDKFVEFVRVTWPPVQSVLHTLESVFQKVFGTIANVIERVWRIVKPILDQFRHALGDLDPTGILGKLGGGLGKLFSGGDGGGGGGLGGLFAGGGVAGGDGASLPTLSSLRNSSMLPSPGSPLPRLSELRGTQPWLLHPPGMPSAAPSAAMPGDSPLVTALRAQGFSPQLIRLIQGFSQVEGNNPAGVPTLGFTDAQLGGATDLQSRVNALAQQFKDRANVAGPFPEGGTDQQQAQWIAKVVGQTGLKSDWQGNAQPQDYVQRVMTAMGGAPMGAGMPGMTGMPSMGAAPGYAGDSALLAHVPAGTYLQTQAADLTKGIGDCSSAVEDLINMLDGVSTAGRQMSTSNAPQWLTAHGFMPTNTLVPGAFNVGFNDEHMQATLPGGTNFNWGSGAAAAGRGIGGTGAFDPSFTQHYYRPANGMPNMGGMYPSAAGMPTLASPQGVSPEGIPLGTQNSPLYVMPAQASGAQQLGQDFVSGIAEVFGFDGTLFKNPLDSGLFKGFKGLMSFLTGGGKGGKQGLPGSAFAGGDGGGMPQMGGGGDLFSGLGSMLTGIMPQPFGQITKGGPAQAPDEFQPMLPGSGGNTGLPGSFTPSGNKTAGGGNQIDQSINIGQVNGKPSDIHQTMVDVNVPRARQGVQSIPGMSMP